MTRVLVLGSGQLGLMMAAAASRLGVQLDRLDPENWTLLRGTSPTPEPLPSDWRGEAYDHVTVEREHFPDRAVLQVFDSHPGFKLADTLHCLADRRRQKSFLDELGIATSEWLTVRDRADLAELQHRVGLGLVLKAATGGYDGRGQWRINDPQPEVPAEAVPGQLIAERVVAFEREVSLVGARNRRGECVFYPLVENEHRHGMLVCTIAPAELASGQQAEAEDMLRRIMDALDYVGVMAMECFEESGRLLVNELAPRVHNSGHWTQEGASIDQFEMHVRALANLPLTIPETTRNTAMLNLVGTAFDPAWLDLGKTRLHWYGKEVRPGRKLGHLNVYGATNHALLDNLEALMKRWDPMDPADIQRALDILKRDIGDARGETQHTRPERQQRISP